MRMSHLFVPLVKGCSVSPRVQLRGSRPSSAMIFSEKTRCCATGQELFMKAGTGFSRAATSLIRGESSSRSVRKKGSSISMEAPFSYWSSSTSYAGFSSAFSAAKRRRDASSFSRKGANMLKSLLTFASCQTAPASLVSSCQATYSSMGSTCRLSYFSFRTSARRKVISSVSSLCCRIVSRISPVSGFTICL